MRGSLHLHRLRSKCGEWAHLHSGKERAIHGHLYQIELFQERGTDQGRKSLFASSDAAFDTFAFQSMRRSSPRSQSSLALCIWELPSYLSSASSQLLPYVHLLKVTVFSVHSVEQKRLALIRIFSFLVVIVAVIVIASGLLRTIIHFMLKVCTLVLLLFLWSLIIIQSDLIDECTALAQGDVDFRWGIWDADPPSNLTASEATDCSFLFVCMSRPKHQLTPFHSL